MLSGNNIVVSNNNKIDINDSKIDESKFVKNKIDQK